MSSKNASKEWCNLYVKEVIHKYNPKFKIRPKSESKLFKFLAPVLKLINPGFFTNYTTTVFGTMWVTDTFFNNPPEHALKVTAHEGRHEYDRDRLMFGLFEIMYLFPQILFVPLLVLGVFWSYWLLAPAIVFLAPLPAPWRYKLEMKGYAMDKIWNNYVYSHPDSFSDEHVVHAMSSLQTYYSTWPFKSWIYKDLAKPLDLEGDPGFADVIAFLERHGFKS